MHRIPKPVPAAVTRLTIGAAIAVLALALVLTRAPGLDARAPGTTGHIVAALPGYHSAAELRRIGPLSPADADEAARGTISPDGRWFAYEVLRGGEWSIWQLDVATARATPLKTPVGGTAPGWSPEGSRLAYVRASAGWPHAASGGEIVILDLERGVDRVLHAEPADTGLVFGPTWWGDSAILAISQAPPSLATQFRSIRVRDGAVRVLTPPRRFDEAPAVSPDGRRVAFFSSLCCGAGGRALWVMELDGSGARRCLAGPLRNEGARPAWSADGRTIYFAAARSADAVSRAYAVDVDGAGGRGAYRIEQLDGRVASVSTTRTGEVALVVVPPERRTGVLWLLSRPASAPVSTDSIPACPEAATRVPEFVRREGLPNVLDIGVIARALRARFALFGVTYGREMDWGGLYERRVGVQYGDRLGWLSTGGLTSTPKEVDSVARRHTLFRLTAADRELLSESFDSALARNAPAAVRPWREFVLQHAFAPSALLRRYLREDPELAGRIASSPALLHPDMPRDVLLSMAEADPQIARAALDAGRLDDAQALLRLARASRPERPIISEDELYRRLYALGPALAADPRTSEDVLAALALATWYSSDSSLQRTLVRNPSARRSRRVLLLLAARSLDGGTTESEQVRALLAPGGFSPERTLLELLATVPPSERELIARKLVLTSTLAQQSAPVLLRIAADSTLSRNLRDIAAQTLAWDRAASEADLLALIRTLADRPSDYAARHLLGNGTVRQSPTLLRAIMELRSLQDTTIRASARQLLEEQAR